MTVKIVTDSTSDLTPEITDKLGIKEYNCQIPCYTRYSHKGRSRLLLPESDYY